MTYKEWMATTVKRFGIGADDVELMLVNRVDMIPDADAEVNPTTAKRALVAEFATAIPLANVSEGAIASAGTGRPLNSGITRCAANSG